MTLVVRQTPDRATAAEVAPVFDVGAVERAPDGEVPDAQVSLSAADVPPAALDPLRALELALIELYLLPDVAAEDAR